MSSNTGTIETSVQAEQARTVDYRNQFRPNNENMMPASPSGTSIAAGGTGGLITVPLDLSDRKEFPWTSSPLILGTQFPRRAWDPNLYAQAVLAEFAASGWMNKVHLEPPPKDEAAVVAEVKTLRELGFKWRARRMNEIIAQAVDLSVYWSAMLMATPSSRPATWDLIACSIAIGQMVGMHFKLKFQRPRPAQLCPALMPPILTPPHPSYPNNHALQSHLIANVISIAAPALASVADTLAYRIGVNREIAGVHFPSDRAAGKSLAAQLTPLVREGPLFSDILQAASEEWTGISSVPIPALPLDEASPP